LRDHARTGDKPRCAGCRLLSRESPRATAEALMTRCGEGMCRGTAPSTHAYARKGMARLGMPRERVSEMGCVAGPIARGGGEKQHGALGGRQSLGTGLAVRSGRMSLRESVVVRPGVILFLWEGCEPDQPTCRCEPDLQARQKGRSAWSRSGGGRRPVTVEQFAAGDVAHGRIRNE
jgi:hypothetical protein